MRLYKGNKGVGDILEVCRIPYHMDRREGGQMDRFWIFHVHHRHEELNPPAFRSDWQTSTQTGNEQASWIEWFTIQLDFSSCLESIVSFSLSLFVFLRSDLSLTTLWLPPVNQWIWHGHGPRRDCSRKFSISGVLPAYVMPSTGVLRLSLLVAHVRILGSADLACVFLIWPGFSCQAYGSVRVPHFHFCLTWCFFVPGRPAAVCISLAGWIPAWIPASYLAIYLAER